MTWKQTPWEASLVLVPTEEITEYTADWYCMGLHVRLEIEADCAAYEVRTPRGLRQLCRDQEVTS